MSTKTTFLNTLANGLEVLEVLVGRELTLRELAESVELPRQTVYRIVYTLMETGWVDRDIATDAYRLSPNLWSLGTRSFGHDELRKAFAPDVRSLSEEWGETVHLAVYDRGHVVYIGKEEGTHPIRSYTELGGRSPAYCVATGKVLLAAQGVLEWDRVVKSGLEKYTEATITSRANLISELEKVRAEGFAVNQGEWREGVGGIAVPILSPAGETIAGMGFSGPSDRILPRLEELLEGLRKSAQAGMARLGGKYGA